MEFVLAGYCVARMLETRELIFIVPAGAAFFLGLWILTD